MCLNRSVRGDGQCEVLWSGEREQYRVAGNVEALESEVLSGRRMKHGGVLTG